MQTLLVIFICLVIAYLLSELSRSLGLPRVIGQVTAGFILSIGVIKSHLFSADSLEALTFLSKLGIILLFYYVGLETNFKAFTKNIKKSVMISIFNTSLPLILGYAVTRYVLGFEMLTSLIVGVSLSVSAQSVSIDILEELKILKTKLGGLIVSAGAIDDTIELLMVTILLSIFHSAISNLTVSKLILDIFIFITVIILIKLVFLPYTLKLFDREHSSTSRFMGSIIIVLLMASLSEFLGLGLMIGAIIAGIIVRQTIFKEVNIPDWEEHDIARSTHIIAFGFLIPLFFVSIGLNTNLSMIMPNLDIIGLFLLIATIGTVGGTIIATKLGGGKFKEGAILGWGLNPKGDVELVIMSLALEYLIITQQIYTALVITSIVTTIMSPIIFKQLLSRYTHYLDRRRKTLN